MRNFVSSCRESNVSGRSFDDNSRQISSVNKYQTICFSLNFTHNLKIKGHLPSVTLRVVMDRCVFTGEGLQCLKYCLPSAMLLPFEMRSPQENRWMGHVSTCL